MQGRSLKLLVVALVMAGAVSAGWSDVRLPGFFGSHMVLQRDMPVPIWGWADAGEAVSVKLGDMRAVTTTAGADGKWKVWLPEMPAGGPFTLTVTGKNTLTLDDVLVGEVWLCSGQSNMEWVVANSKDRDAEIASAKYPQIRHIKIPKVPLGLPQDDISAPWEVCSPETVGNFTAVGYFMARHLHKELNVPIGLINSSWGGTRIEPWVPPVGFQDVPALESIAKQVALADPRTDAYKDALKSYLGALEAWIGTARERMAQEKILEPSPAYPGELLPLTGHQQPTSLYNGMIHALIPYAMRGAIWYQGESNHGEGMLYTEKMRALIQGWRKLWGQGDFPFYYVQIAPYGYGTEDPYVLATFWEAQAAALSIPGTGMVLANDISDLNDIHPRNKQDVGKRLALLALKNDYGRPETVASGPTFRALEIEDGKLRVRFDNVGSGLVSRDGKPLNWFEIVGTETDFTPADAVIEGDSVVLSSPDVPDPVAMRFAWHKNAEPNLSNREGLPAVPFRAGEVPIRDWLKLKVGEARDFVLVYDLDLSKLGKEVTYTTDNHRSITGGFSRVAYFLELESAGQATKWVYVSMDPFTQDPGKIGVPTLASKAVFQTRVKNMNVLSNVPGIVTGSDLSGGNIEFWPHNYGQPNAIGIPNASASVWDFGDQYGPPEDGYGSMQVHNHEAKQTIFAINNWKAGGNADIGIGNSDGDTRDWTFKSNASSYSLKRLRVLVKPN